MPRDLISGGLDLTFPRLSTLNAIAVATNRRKEEAISSAQQKEAISDEQCTFQDLLCANISADF